MNQLDLNERHAVVTGGASGIGFAIAERLAASGATITIWDVDEAAGQKAATALASQAFCADVTDFASVAKAVEDTLKIVRVLADRIQMIVVRQWHSNIGRTFPEFG